MTENPDRIRADIERTQERVSEDVDAIGDKVDPRNIAHRQTEKVREAASNVKDKIFGRDDAPDSGALDSAREAASRAPQKIRDRAQGNPLGAGVVAFGVGMLVSSLIPASDQEEKVMARVKQKAGEELGDAASEAADNLRQPVKEAMEAVKETAGESAETLKDEGRAEAQGVAAEAGEAGERVRGSM
jgi:hypothetical protein